MHTHTHMEGIFLCSDQGISPAGDNRQREIKTMEKTHRKNDHKF